jgi:protein-S-isoprenylcysteine O-methyltransferase Ste14
MTDCRQTLFRFRSYTPLPFLLVMLYFAEPKPESFVVGFMMIAFGEFLRLWGVAIAGSETRTTGAVGGTFLITTGPFGYVRNPLYVGNMIIYAGVGVLSNAIFPWLTIIAVGFFYAQYRMIISLEEEHLTTMYGEEFVQYCRAVPRFFPRFSAYRGGAGRQPSLNWQRGIASERRTLQAIVLITLAVGLRWMWG